MVPEAPFSPPKVEANGQSSPARMPMNHINIRYGTITLSAIAVRLP